MGTANFQGQLWGAKASDWARTELQSNHLFRHVLNKVITNGESDLLDIGCGAGTLCKMAYESGINVHGLDASEALVLLAKKLVPEGNFYTGEMEELPFSDNSFDAVTGVNSFQFAGDIVNAFKEARRVVKQNGKVAAVVWGKPEDCEASVVFSAIGPYMPQLPKNPNAKPPLYANGTVKGIAQEAGLKHLNTEEIETIWEFGDEIEALNAFMSAGMVNLAVNNAGKEVIEDLVLDAIQKFKKFNSKFIVRNKFLCSIFEKTN